MATASKKSEQTRERILETALKLFADKGYDKTTMRQIAKEADVSLGLAYRYFSSKDEFCISLYEKLTAESAAFVDKLEPAPLSENLEKMYDHIIKLLVKNRDPLTAFAGRALDRRSDVFVLGMKSSPVRELMTKNYQRIVEISENDLINIAPERLAAACYMAHLAFAFYWLLDPTKNSKHTKALSKFLLKKGKEMAPLLAMLNFEDMEDELLKFIEPLV